MIDHKVQWGNRTRQRTAPSDLFIGCGRKNKISEAQNTMNYREYISDMHYFKY